MEFGVEDFQLFGFVLAGFFFGTISVNSQAKEQSNLAPSQESIPEYF